MYVYYGREIHELPEPGMLGAVHRKPVSSCVPLMWSYGEGTKAGAKSREMGGGGEALAPGGHTLEHLAPALGCLFRGTDAGKGTSLMLASGKWKRKSRAPQQLCYRLETQQCMQSLSIPAQ